MGKSKRNLLQQSQSGEEVVEDLVEGGVENSVSQEELSGVEESGETSLLDQIAPQQVGGTEGLFDDVVEDTLPQLTEEQRDELRHEKRKLKRERTGLKVGNAFSWLGQLGVSTLNSMLTMPVDVIDQLSSLDLHVKDGVDYLRTGKTRDERLKGKKHQHNRGTTDRRLGRTQLHYMMNTGQRQSRNNKVTPFNGEGSLNPFLHLSKHSTRSGAFGKIREKNQKKLDRKKNRIDWIREQLGQG